MATPDNHGMCACPHCGHEFTVDGWREALDLLELNAYFVAFGGVANEHRRRINDFLRAHGRLT